MRTTRQPSLYSKAAVFVNRVIAAWVTLSMALGMLPNAALRQALADGEVPALSAPVDAYASYSESAD
jgi:hypothetical protein